MVWQIGREDHVQKPTDYLGYMQEKSAQSGRLDVGPELDPMGLEGVYEELSGVTEINN